MIILYYASVFIKGLEASHNWFGYLLGLEPNFTITRLQNIELDKSLQSPDFKFLCKLLSVTVKGQYDFE